MKATYEKGPLDIVPEGLQPFRIDTKNGTCHGVYSQEKNTIFVHGVYGDNCLKELMEILITKFKTNKVTFTPLITESIPNKVRGEIKILKADHPDNPYGEELRYLETEWEVNKNGEV